jgi:hypothetical protein
VWKTINYRQKIINYRFSPVFGPGNINRYPERNNSIEITTLSTKFGPFKNQLKRS